MTHSAATAPPALPGGYRLVALNQVDSTNAYAARLAEHGETGPLWIWAAEQTAGRGRRGRQWISEPGNLYATLLLSVPVDAATAAQLSFVAALAVHDMVAALTGNAHDLCLKWPNDVLLDGAKVSGILSEVLNAPPGGAMIVAIGCGVNLVHAPKDTRYGAVSLAGKGHDVQPANALSVLAEGLDHWLGIWADGSGFDRIRQAWLDRTYRIGQPLTLDAGGTRITGAFNGLTSNGAIMLKLPNGTIKSFVAGEVIQTVLE